MGSSGLRFPRVQSEPGHSPRRGKRSGHGLLEAGRPARPSLRGAGGSSSSHGLGIGLSKRTTSSGAFEGIVNPPALGEA